MSESNPGLKSHVDYIRDLRTRFQVEERLGSQFILYRVAASGWREHDECFTPFSEPRRGRRGNTALLNGQDPTRLDIEIITALRMIYSYEHSATETPLPLLQSYLEKERFPEPLSAPRDNKALLSGRGLTQLDIDINTALGMIHAYEHPAPETPWSLIPSYLEKALSDLESAKSRRAAQYAKISIWLERELRAGTLKLRGRPYSTAPLGRPLATDHCAGLRFDEPEPGAVTLANGATLFDCKVERTPFAKGASSAARPLSDKAKKERFEAWISARLADGLEITGKAAEAANELEGIPRTERRRMIGEAGFKRNHGRPPKPK